MGKHKRSRTPDNFRHFNAACSPKPVDDVIMFDISGTEFKCKQSTTRQIPGSRLFNLNRKQQEYDPFRRVYCYERDASMFRQIISAHRDGEVHVPKDICALQFRKEMEFWGIPQRLLAPCCWKQFYETSDDMTTINILLENGANVEVLADSEANQETSSRAHIKSASARPGGRKGLQSKVWLFLDDPTSSPAAKIWCFLYIFVVLLSVVTFVIYMEPAVRVDKYLPAVSVKRPPPHPSRPGQAQTDGQPSQGHRDHSHSNSQTPDTEQTMNASRANQNDAYSGGNISDPSTHAQNISSNNTVTDDLQQYERPLPHRKPPGVSDLLLFITDTDPHIVLLSIDAFCTLFFVVETLAHFCTCPKKLHYPKNPYNVLRLALAVTTAVAFVTEVRKDLITSKDIGKLVMTFKAMGVLRLLLIFRLRRFYNGLQIMLLSIEHSVSQFFLLVFVFFIGAVTYGGLMFCMEINTGTFPDIFRAMWWSVITMTTVGYGDYYPSTTFGYLIGVVCALNGLIVLAMPIAAIASNFAAFYARNADVTNHLKAIARQNKEKRRLPESRIKPIASNEEQSTHFFREDMRKKRRSASHNGYVIYQPSFPGRKNDDIVLDIGGTIFRCKESTAGNIPGSRLSVLDQTSREYDPWRRAYCYNRDPDLFRHILNAYRNRELHMPKDVCGIQFRKEMEFWGIPQRLLAPCCWRQFYETSNDVQTLATLLQNGGHEETLSKLDSKLFHTVGLKTVKMSADNAAKPPSKLWLFLEDPTSSKAAKIWCFLYILMVVISVVTFSIWLEPGVRVDKYLPGMSVKEPRAKFVHVGGNVTQTKSVEGNLTNFQNNINSTQTGGALNVTKTGMYPNDGSPSSNNRNDFENFVRSEALLIMRSTDPHVVLLAIDSFCVFFFTLETVFHFCACPHKHRYPRNPYNVLRLVLAITTMVSFAVEMRKDVITTVTIGKIVSVFRALSVLRLLLILRLRRFYTSLQIVLLSVESSASDFVLLLFGLFIATIIYGGLIFCMEIDTGTFPDIFRSMWWAVITMTTVGYGDLYPSNTFGYLIGVVCALNGLIVLAMPIAAIASNFATFYARNADFQNHLQAIDKQDNEPDCC